MALTLIKPTKVDMPKKETKQKKERKKERKKKKENTRKKSPWLTYWTERFELPNPRPYPSNEFDNITTVFLQRWL